MRSKLRRGFMISPRIAFPVLLVIVVAMFFIFASFSGTGVSSARIVSTAIVSILLLFLFGILAVVSRAGGRRGGATERSRESQRLEL